MVHSPVDPPLSEVIERTSLRAWPAFREEHVGGWVLRFADGYTKRANSATLLRAAELDPEREVVECERRFAAVGLPSVFRLLSFSTPNALDALLEDRGYDSADPTIVLHRTLRESRLASTSPLETTDLDGWLALYCRFHESSVDEHATHRRILAAIRSPKLFATLRAGGEVTACGLGVLEESRFGLFDLVTARAYRNRGLGRKLIQGMLAWAEDRGADQAYLQVTESNSPARHLYRSLGFAELYRYWYRVPRSA